MASPPTLAADERGQLNETRILAVAIAGGVIVAPVAARAQPGNPPPPRQEAPAFVPAPAPAGTSARADAPVDNRSIVPDDQFRSALPPLDPSLYEPLPPIDPAAPAFPPVPGPVEDAPLGDPALSEPLPPLSSFSTAPVGEQPAASDAEGETVQRVRYTLVVEGMQETGLEGRFRDLSALDDAEGEARQRGDDRGADRGRQVTGRPPASLRGLL